jgi:hypothetical protein
VLDQGDVIRYGWLASSTEIEQLLNEKERGDRETSSEVRWHSKTIETVLGFFSSTFSSRHEVYLKRLARNARTLLIGGLLCQQSSENRCLRPDLQNFV